MAKSSSTTKKKLPYAHIAFLLAGLLLLVYYLLNEGVPSFGKDVASIITFIVDLIVLISAIGFYCYMVFSPKGLTGTIRALAPALVIFVVMGRYAMPSIKDENIQAIVSAIATGAATLIVFCGFLFVFLHKWIFGEIFGWSCFVYAIYVIVAYFVARALKISIWLGFGNCLTALYGFPFNAIITESMCKEMAATEDEREYLMAHMFPSMIVGGFSTVTITSVIIAGLFVNLF